MSEHFSTLSQRFLRRRTLLKTAGLAGAGALLPRLARAGTPLVGFAALPNALLRRQLHALLRRRAADRDAELHAQRDLGRSWTWLGRLCGRPGL